VPGHISGAGQSPAGERIRSFAIVTTQPNELCAKLHNRMPVPVVLAPEAWPVWLGEETADQPHLKALHFRFAPGDPAFYKSYASELVGLSPDVLLAGASPAVPPLRRLMNTIPIVFVLVADPVGAGLCPEPRATRPQYHRVQHPRRTADGKMASVVKRGSTSCQPSCFCLQPGYGTIRLIVQPRH
jgi:hypothetical protein